MTIHNDEVDLPSFRHIKEKTNRDLYEVDTSSSTYDKSPKGSVDIPIRHVVDLINEHSSYATLSSCSGRIALFDPNFYNLEGLNENNDAKERKVEPSEDEVRDDDAENAIMNESGNGKGRSGRWLLASHAKITVEQLEEAIMNSSQVQSSSFSQSLIFKHEPLLLHVAASNVQRGRELLQIALTNCGLRESGMIHTTKRITVAIRSHALALSVPLARPGHHLYPGRDYLKALVEEANRRFEINERKIDQLFKEIKSVLFHSEDSENKGLGSKPHSNVSSEYSGRNDYDNNESKATFNPFPQIRLWGHCTESIVVPNPVSSDHAPDIDLITIGGYGPGPATNIGDSISNQKGEITDIDESQRDLLSTKESQTKCTRSNKVYFLRRRKDKWDQHWREIQNEDQTSFTFSPREGHASCVLQLSQYLTSNSTFAQSHLHAIAIFGGRASPVKPSNELVLYCHSTVSDKYNYFYKPNINGQSPPARWGHTFTALGASSAKNGYLAIVIGGRNEKIAFPTMHVLSVKHRPIPSGESLSQALSTKRCLDSVEFTWHEVNIDTPLFHHSAVLVPQSTYSKDDADTMFIFGGLSNPLNLLEAAQTECDDESSSLTGSRKNSLRKLRISFNRKNVDCQPTVCMESVVLEGGLNPSFASALRCISYFPTDSEPVHYLAICGGVTSFSNKLNVGNVSPIQIMRILGSNFDEYKAHSITTDCKMSSDLQASAVDSSLIIHHTCVVIPSKLHERPVEQGCTRDILRRYEMLVLGGGISTFAFGPTFSW